MKFVIDVPEEYIYDGKLRIHDDDVYYPCEKNWTDTKINMTPYYVQNDHIRDEVWNFVRIIMADKENGGMSLDDMAECFDTTWISCVVKLSYKEAREKYDAWKKKKSEIKVGDEVVYNNDSEKIMIVTKISISDETISGIGKNGETYSNYFSKCWRKTGRSFPEVVELLNKMKEKTDGV